MKLEEILKLKKECGFLNPNHLTMADVFMMLCEREDGAAIHLIEMCYKDAKEKMQTDPEFKKESVKEHYNYKMHI